MQLLGTYRPREGSEGDADDLVEDERFGQISRREPLIEEVILDFTHASPRVAFASDDGQRRCEQEGGEETNPSRRTQWALRRSPFPSLSEVQRLRERAHPAIVEVRERERDKDWGTEKDLGNGKKGTPSKREEDLRPFSCFFYR